MEPTISLSGLTNNMIAELLQDHQFQALEKEYKFLARARGASIQSAEYVILDVETTGLDPLKNELIEIGAMKIQGQEVKEVFSSLIKPKVPISSEITRITGIDDEMVKDFPAAEQVLPGFLDFIGSAILVAHNAEFDLAFIKNQAKLLLNKEITNESICTVKVARFLLPSIANHKLHTVASHFDLPLENRHRAMGDVELTYQVWTRFIDQLKEKNIQNKRDLDVLISQL